MILSLFGQTNKKHEHDFEQHHYNTYEFQLFWSCLVKHIVKQKAILMNIIKTKHVNLNCFVRLFGYLCFFAFVQIPRRLFQKVSQKLINTRSESRFSVTLAYRSHQHKENETLNRSATVSFREGEGKGREDGKESRNETHTWGVRVFGSSFLST